MKLISLSILISSILICISIIYKNSDINMRIDNVINNSSNINKLLGNIDKNLNNFKSSQLNNNFPNYTYLSRNFGDQSYVYRINNTNGSIQVLTPIGGFTNKGQYKWNKLIEVK